jgi:hypothetical protein
MCATSSADGLELLELGDERPVAALAAGHRLGARSSLALADLRSLPELSDALPHEPLDAIVDRAARGLLVVVVGEGVADRLGGAVNAVPVVDYPITHLVLAWPADQAHAPRAELVRMAQRLARQGRLAPVGHGAGAEPRRANDLNGTNELMTHLHDARFRLSRTGNEAGIRSRSHLGPRIPPMLAR